MSRAGRFLVVAPPLAGHVNPTLPLGRELLARGHDVAWAGYPEVLDGMVPPSGRFIPVADEMSPAVLEAIVTHISQGTRGVAAFKSAWEEFYLPIAHQMLPGVRSAVDTFTPDVLVVDQQALAGAAVAELRSLPWATSASTSAELADPLAALPKLAAWRQDLTTDFLVEAGLDQDRAGEIDPRFSPRLVLAFTTAELLGADGGLPDSLALVGPSIHGRLDETPFPWDWLDQPGPHVLVTLGTHNWRGGGRFFAATAEALGQLGARGILVAPPDLVPEPPEHVLVRSRVPQVTLMPRVDAVVCHAGHNTVCESLAFGHPLVVSPIREDQPIVADQVVRAGAGVRVMFSRATGPKMLAALQAVLTEPGYRTAAERIRASFESSGGPAEAADRLEALLASTDPAAEHDAGATRR